MLNCAALLLSPAPLAAPTHPRSAASFGHSFGAAEAGSHQRGSAALQGNDPYAWAQRLRDIPDEDALAELGLLGYTDASAARRGGAGGSFSFASGTGSSKKGKRRNSVGRAVSPVRRR